MKRFDGRVGIALLLLAACREAPVVDSMPAADQTTHPESSEASLREARHRRQPGGCGTLTDAEDPDTLRVSRYHDGVVLYANAQVGLAIVDVSDPDEPKVGAASELVGTPIGIFETAGAAIVVAAPWDRPSETIVRAVEIEPRRAGRTLGEIVLPGAPRDARRLGEAIVVTRDLPPASTEGSTMTAVTSFVLEGDLLSRRDELRLPGRGAVTGGSPYGVAVARPAEAELGADRTSVTWIGVDPELGSLRLHGTATFSGVVPRWRRATDHVIDVEEDARVRVVACATAACPAGDLAAYASIDFSEPNRPRVASWSLIARAGDGVFGFDGERLIVARPPVEPIEATDISFFHTSAGLVPAGTVRVPGTVSSLAARDGSVIALGWTGSASAGKRAIIHQLDVRRAPQLVGSTGFGGDWSWSPAYEDDRAMSFDPSTTLGALPMTTVRGRTGAVAAAQVLSFGPSGPRAVMEQEAVADRLLFVEGRLLAFSADGVTNVRHPGERPFRRRWEDGRSLIR